MSIRRRGKTWQVDYTDITGKRVRQSGFKKKEDAENRMSKRKAV